MKEGIWQSLLDYIFPLWCLGCETEGFLICESCLEKTVQDLAPALQCPVCHTATTHGQPCASCQAQSALSALVSRGPYQEKGLWAELIQACKYEYSPAACELITRVTANYFQTAALQLKFDYIVPVPLHKRRQASRGYNQSDMIARGIAASTKQKIARVLVRTRYTEQQAKLGRAERQKNIKQAFAIQAHSLSLQNKHFLLVDDVYTTGSTMQECARVLLEAGAATVSGFTLARG